MKDLLVEPLDRARTGIVPARERTSATTTPKVPTKACDDLKRESTISAPWRPSPKRVSMLSSTRVFVVACREG